MKNKSEQSMSAASLDKLNLCKCSHWLRLPIHDVNNAQIPYKYPYPHSRLLAPTEQGLDRP